MSKKIIVFLMCLSVAITLFIGNLKPATASGETVNVWMTTSDGTQLLNAQSSVTFGADQGAAGTGITINIDENTQYQQFDGVGAALTDSAAWLINTKMSAAQRNTLLTNLFSSSGAGINFIRVPMTTSDFTANNVSYTDDDNGPDPNQTNFNINHDLTNIVPVIKAALAINPNLQIVATPWSAPAWMKSNNALNSGSLNSANFPSYATLFVKYIQAYAAQGITVNAITIQNEPLNATSSYASMSMSAADQTTFIKSYLGPAFASNNITTKILTYDHNWDQPSYPLSVLGDSTAYGYVAGTAFHGYAGNVDAQTQVHNAYPNKDIYFTEVSGGAWYTQTDQALSFQMQAIEIGTFRNWARSALLWNIALDTNSGPQMGGCNNCRGVVTIDQATGNVTYNTDYYGLGHLGRFVVHGAKRIDSISSPPSFNPTTTAYMNNVQSVAFKNPDGSKVLLVYNSSASSSAIRVRWGDESFNYTIPSDAALTFKWSGTQFGSTTTPASSQIQSEYYNTELSLNSETTSDTGGGLDMGYASSGSYLGYKNIDFGAGATTVSARVATTGATTLEFRLGSTTGTLIATVNVPNTGGWQTWQTATATVIGASGVQDLYIVFRGSANLNWFSFATTFDAFSQIEAERFTSMSSTQNEITSDTGGGLDVGYANNNSWLAYNSVNFGTGATTVNARVATMNSGSTIEYHLNSAIGTLLGTVSVPNTGGWQTWQTASTSISGASGTQNLYVVFKGGNGVANLNWFTFSAGIPNPTNTPTSSISTTAWYSITNQGNGKCVDDTGGGTTNGTVLQQYACPNPNHNQEWQFQTTDSGYYKVVSRNSTTLGWDVVNASTADGALMQLWTYGGGANQQWQPVSLGSGYYKFVNRNSGKCLDVPGASTTDGVQLDQYTCNGTGAQSWLLTSYP